MTDTATETTTWTIDASHTAVEFAVKHMMFATARGRFSDVSGQITVDTESIGNSAVNVEIATASVDTRDAKRDEHLRSADFFDVETFPAITFASTQVKAAGSKDLTVTGDLTIRDVTKPVVLAVEHNGTGTNPWGQQVTSYTASTTISRKDYGLTWNSTLESGGVLVGDDVKITIDLEANA